MDVLKLLGAKLSILLRIAAISDRTGMTGDKIGFQNIGIFCERTSDNDKNNATIIRICFKVLQLMNFEN